MWVSPRLHESVELVREGESGAVFERVCWNESVPVIDHNEFRVHWVYVTVSLEAVQAISVSLI